MTTPYLSLSEVATHLGVPHNTLKSWDQQNLLPSPDAIFGHLHSDDGSIRAWDADRVAALVTKNAPGVPNGVADYEWEVTPVRYLTAVGISELLGRPLNTVKFWIIQGRRERGDHPRKQRPFPAPDARAGRNVGWRRETIEEWSSAVRKETVKRGQRVYVLAERGVFDEAAFGDTAITVYRSRTAAMRDLAGRYRDGVDRDGMQLSDEEAGAAYLAEHHATVDLTESALYS